MPVSQPVLWWRQGAGGRATRGFWGDSDPRQEELLGERCQWGCPRSKLGGGGRREEGMAGVELQR